MNFLLNVPLRATGTATTVKPSSLGATLRRGPVPLSDGAGALSWITSAP
jgi:hypothetical protein